ncbi:MAG: hypothetical protein H7343_22185 [Undibacterium sp.]|nr:hypothetical protein [Opitutaceae bacterium]
MVAVPETLHRFLAPQIRDFGAQVEIDAGLWAVFVVASADAAPNTLAHSLIDSAPFPYKSGPSSDDQWTLYYVTTEHRLAAVHWLDDLVALCAGAIRPAAPEHLALIAELLESTTPHRPARQLGDLHDCGAVTAGIARTPLRVRALLDRLHAREPLYFAAFETLLTHHLIDLAVLHRQLIPEDVALKNEIVRAGLSRDPFLQSRQDATTRIRDLLLRFGVLNATTHQKNTAITNPYAAFLDVARADDHIPATINGELSPIPVSQFIAAIRSIRLAIYQGETFTSGTSAAPWIHQEIAAPCRFIRQRLAGNPALSTLDALYMLERSVEI